MNPMTFQIDKTIESTQTQINQIKEYRTALISEVVTGKIDVRDEVWMRYFEFLFVWWYELWNV